MSDAKKYEGSCHCGNVKYEVNADLSGMLITCNCSICSRTGAVLTFVPRSEFKLLQGEEAVTDYQFNKKSIHHYFCSTCGIRSYAYGEMPDGTEMAAINVRCLEGVDATKLQPQHFDGASR